MAATDLTEASTSRYAKVGDLNIHYNDTETAGSVVICLHGAGPGASSWSNFVRNVGPLSARHRVILADMPNYGKSDDFIGNDPNLNVRAAIGLLDALSIEKAHLIGNSAEATTAHLRRGPSGPCLEDRGDGPRQPAQHLCPTAHRGDQGAYGGAYESQPGGAPRPGQRDALRCFAD
jgi:hypothetical protein